MENKLKKIFIVSGKARHGKDTTCSFIKELCEEKGLKVINLAYGNYIKEYEANLITIEDIAKKYSVSIDRIFVWARKYGVSRRNKNNHNNNI